MFLSNYDTSPSQMLVIYLVIYSKTDEMFLSNYDTSPSQEVHLFHEITWCECLSSTPVFKQEVLKQH